MFSGFDMGGAMAGMGLWWLLLVAALVALVAFALRRDGRPPASGPTARDILDQRFARGELGADDYEAMKRRLAD